MTDTTKSEIYDEKLFKQPPPLDDCPICFVRLPSNQSAQTYQPCCGKIVCNGCMYAPLYDDQGNKIAERKCPFCRITAPTSEKEVVKRYEKRVELGDSNAMFDMGGFYDRGIRGFTQDYTKALELWHRAGELGNAQALQSIGYCYFHGEGVERNEKIALQYYERAAIMGDYHSRRSLGIEEMKAWNISRAKKHYLIAARDGNENAVTNVLKLYSRELATKEEYENALRSYQEYVAEVKTSQRDDAAKLMDMKYY